MIVHTIQELSEMLKVDHKVVRNLITNRELEAFRVGRQWRVTQEALEEYMAKGGA